MNCRGTMQQLGDQRQVGRLVVELCVCRVCGALAWLSPRLAFEACGRGRRAAA